MNATKGHINTAQENDGSKLDNALQALKAAIIQLPYKKQNIIADWLFTWSKYLSFEQNFKPERLRHFRRGDIVHIHLGFNVGNEQGGSHYAVVVDINNNRGSGCVVVVPISSLDKDKGKENIHGSEVYLGKVIPNSETESYAQLLQIRCISKLRIIKPKAENDMIYRLTSEQMDNIDRKILELFTKKS
ncbi:MAG: type II toxin-antitoxin system PemK/MazF family toxin [Oscillospiraceae bacterium]|nr:type II toxin-antitoxin system PemK/MazF family toxin [Oscillospiraceae bacterium]